MPLVLNESDTSSKKIPLQGPYLFVCCQLGAEAALKAELQREHPELRFAFSRPGFLTFKNANEAWFDAGFELHSIFARAYGLSLKSVEEKKLTPPANLISEILAELKKMRPALQSWSRRRLHVWLRDRYSVGEEPPHVDVRAERNQLEASLRQAILADAELKTLFEEEPEALPGDLVIDVISIDSNHLWLGVHEHHSQHASYAGGNPLLELPQHAPSRAYLKLAEGVLWSKAPLREGQTAVEIGSAPGGACLYLLERGLNVVGIDPADMDPSILKVGSRRFRHLKKGIDAVRREELPQDVHWLLMDMNVGPHRALGLVERLAERMSDTLLGVFFTLKLNEWRYAHDLPSALNRIRDLGIVKVRATQLASNKQEVFVYGLTRKGRNS
jgi:23S rRNA (cytidine2498-2'-O)-methyltransferase